MVVILVGNKCVICKNKGTYNTSSVKTYQVFKLTDKSFSYFPEGTPHYSKSGWGKLVNAKAFFLLIEI
jgi:hypothetical protein